MRALFQSALDRYFTRRNIKIALAALLALELIILFSGYRVLVWKNDFKMSAFEQYEKQRGALYEYDDIRELSCTYFTGRSFRTLSTTLATPDECPFLLKL